MINNNVVEVAKFRGPVRICEFCRNAALPDPLKTFCKYCVTNGYVATCLKCDGEGMVGAIAPWMASAGPVRPEAMMKSVCDICGGHGVLPARKPVETSTVQPVAKELPKRKEPEPATI